MPPPAKRTKEKTSTELSPPADGPWKRISEVCGTNGLF